MNTISLIGFIASEPATYSAGDGLTYTSFRLRVPERYGDSEGDTYSYDDQHTIICIGGLDRYIRTIPRNEKVEIRGKLRSRIHVLRIPGPIAIEVAYPLSEVVADSINWRDLILERNGDDDVLIELYKPELL